MLLFDVRQSENNRVQYQCLVIIVVEGQSDNEILLLLEHLSTITSSLFFMSGKAEKMEA